MFWRIFKRCFDAISLAPRWTPCWNRRQHRTRTHRATEGRTPGIISLFPPVPTNSTGGVRTTLKVKNQHSEGGLVATKRGEGGSQMNAGPTGWTFFLRSLRRGTRQQFGTQNSELVRHAFSPATVTCGRTFGFLPSPIKGRPASVQPSVKP